MANKRNIFADGKGSKKPSSTSGGSDSILANMFSSIMHDTHITFMKWNDLMNAHIRDPRNSVPNNNRDQSSERGNLQKELFKDKMTWKVFCKGMRLLNYVKFELSFKIYHADKKITIHTTMVNLGAPSMIEDSQQITDESEETNDDIVRD